MSEEKASNARFRNWTCIVYPESAPDDWQDILSRHCVPSFISPLHDQDINPTGEPKKPHYHVMLMFDGKKSKSQVEEIFGSIGGVGCEVVKSMRGCARYLCHLDNPEKAQYDPDQVKSIAADYIGTIGLAIDRYIALSEMQQFVERYNVQSFYILAKYASEHRQDWHRILCDSGTVFMREYIKSRYWHFDNDISQELVDQVTGEILKV